MLSLFLTNPVSTSQYMNSVLSLLISASPSGWHKKKLCFIDQNSPRFKCSLQLFRSWFNVQPILSGTHRLLFPFCELQNRALSFTLVMWHFHQICGLQTTILIECTNWPLSCFSCQFINIVIWNFSFAFFSSALLINTSGVLVTSP
jgi:hypothetical protein